MGLLAAAHYDPAAAVSKATSSLIAMTAFDTTNLRLTFTAPANGKVLIRARCTLTGATTMPTILLGVLESSTVVARLSPMGAVPGTAVATTNISQEMLAVVSGISAGSHTYDLAYSVKIVLAATNIKYGGPNDTTASNAWGGIDFEIWEAPNCLAAALYDPASAVSKATTALIAMTAIDTTNLRLTFTAPASGNVLVRMGGVLHGATTFPQILFGVLDGATVRARTPAFGGLKTTAVSTAQLAVEGQAIVTGLTPGNSFTWDAAYSVELVVTSTGLKYGGPNNTTTNNAFGAFHYSIWAT